MQNILIPTNFSAQSLDCVSSLCEQYKGRPLRLVFVHMFKISDSISDLLMLSRRNREYSYIEDDFYKTCETLKARHGQLAIQLEFFYGSSMGNFRDFLEAHGIQGILEPANCVLTKLNPLSVDPLLFIQRSGLPLVNIRPRAKAVPVAEVEAPLVLEEELVEG